ncbi:hypothetical protein LCGC14_2027320 [marine sediment metagenome]|uniref:Uncharacterized protein n=1 Tax=marine sediment metagenome TaxID=412755 RepID=A0A0F9EVR7_9ZZZZ
MMKKISTGLVVFLGMSLAGFVAGGLVMGLLDTDNHSIAYIIWGISSIIGFMRCIQFATFKGEIP